MPQTFIEIYKICRVCPICGAIIENSRYIRCHCCGTDLEMPRWCGSIYYVGFSNIFPNGEKRNAYPDGRAYQSFEEDRNQKALFCPKCKNHIINWKDKFCSICHTPLYNHCLNEGIKLSLECRRCPKCGGLTTYSEIYNGMDNGVIIPRPSRCKLFDKFEYWEYIRYLLRKKEKMGKFLYAVLSESAVYSDMNLFILVFAGDKRHRQNVLSSLPVIASYMETYAFADVQEILLCHYDKTEGKIYWIAPNNNHTSIAGA